MVSDCDSLQKNYEPNQHETLGFGFKPYSPEYEYSPNSADRILMGLDYYDNNGFFVRWEIGDFKETDKI